MTTIAELPPGFADKVLSAQSSFRAVMDAMARPGQLLRIAAATEGPAPLMPATAGIALTLFDHDTPIWLDPLMASSNTVARWIRFHTSAPIVQDPAICSFALIADAAALPAFDRFAFGSDEYPDRSTTLIVQVESLADGAALELRGPGIDGVATLRAAIDAADLIDRLSINATLFPRGIDLILVAGDTIAAIPRTTRLSLKGT
jgi:alpha-D-ribose 1-methylphosphonate 5-triphosphate synthase subunit PhnH